MHVTARVVMVARRHPSASRGLQFPVSTLVLCLACLTSPLPGTRRQLQENCMP